MVGESVGGAMGAPNIVNFVLTATNRTGMGTAAAMTNFASLRQMSYMSGQALTNSLNTAQGAAIAMAGAATLALGAATMEAAKFEQQMNQVAAVSGATASQMSFLGQQAKDMAVKYGADMSMLNEGLITLGRAGLKDSADQAKVLEEGLKLAKMEGIELNDSLEMLITTTGLLGTDVGVEGFTDDLRELNKQLITTAQTAPIKVKDIIATLKYTGGTADLAGLGKGEGREDLFGVIALLGSRGVKGDVAGTALRAFLTRPAAQATPAVDMLGAIGLKPGDLWSKDGNQAKPISEQIQLINDSMDAYELSQMQRIEFWSKMVGPKMANQIMKIDPKAVDPFREKIAEGIDVEERINKILESATEKWNQLKEAFKVGLINVGNNLLVAVKPILDALTWFFKAVGDNPFLGWITTIVLLGGAFLGLVVATKLFVGVLRYAITALRTADTSFNGIMKSLGILAGETEAASVAEGELATNTGILSGLIQDTSVSADMMSGSLGEVSTVTPITATAVNDLGLALGLVNTEMETGIPLTNSLGLENIALGESAGTAALEVTALAIAQERLNVAQMASVGSGIKTPGTGKGININKATMGMSSAFVGSELLNEQAVIKRYLKSYEDTLLKHKAFNNGMFYNAHRSGMSGIKGGGYLPPFTLPGGGSPMSPYGSMPFYGAGHHGGANFNRPGFAYNYGNYNGITSKPTPVTIKGVDLMSGSRIAPAATTTGGIAGGLSNLFTNTGTKGLNNIGTDIGGGQILKNLKNADQIDNVMKNLNMKQFTGGGQAAIDNLQASIKGFKETEDIMLVGNSVNGAQNLIPKANKELTDEAAKIGLMSKLSTFWKEEMVANSLISSTSKIGQSAAAGEGAMASLSTAIMGLASPIGIAIIAIVAIIAVIAIFAIMHDNYMKNLEKLKERFDKQKKAYEENKQKLDDANQSLKDNTERFGENSVQAQKSAENVKKYTKAMEESNLAMKVAANQIAKEESDGFWGMWGDTGSNGIHASAYNLFQKLGMNEQKYEDPSKGTWAAEMFKQKSAGSWDNSIYGAFLKFSSGTWDMDKNLSWQNASTSGNPFSIANQSRVYEDNLQVVNDFLSKNGKAMSKLNTYWSDFTTLYNKQTDALNMVKTDNSNPLLDKMQMWEDIEVAADGSAKLAIDAAHKYGIAGEDFVKSLNDLVKETGMSVDEVKRMLDWMQVEQVVANSNVLMESETDNILKKMDMIDSGISQGNENVSAMFGNTLEAQNAMIDILAQEYADQIWSRAYWTVFWNNAWLSLYEALDILVNSLIDVIWPIAQILIGIWNIADAIGNLNENGFNGVIAALGGFIEGLGEQAKKIPVVGNDIGGWLQDKGKGMKVEYSKKAGIDPNKYSSTQPVSNIKGTWGASNIQSNAAIKGLFESMGIKNVSIIGNGSDQTYVDLKKFLKKNLDMNYRGVAGEGGDDYPGSGTDSIGDGGKGKKKSDLDALKKITVDYVFCKNKRLPDINVNLHDRAPLVGVDQKKLNIGKMEVITRKDNPDDYMNAITNDLIKKADIIAPTIISSKGNPDISI